MTDRASSRVATRRPASAGSPTGPTTPRAMTKTSARPTTPAQRGFAVGWMSAVARRALTARRWKMPTLAMEHFTATTSRKNASLIQRQWCSATRRATRSARRTLASHKPASARPRRPRRPPAATTGTSARQATTATGVSAHPARACVSARPMGTVKSTMMATSATG